MHARQDHRLQLSNEIYARLADELSQHPEHFVAVQEGLLVATSFIKTLLADVTLATAMSVALPDGYLRRATYAYWLLLPHAFDCDDECLPRGVQDHRHARASDVMSHVVAA